MTFNTLIQIHMDAYKKAKNGEFIGLLLYGCYAAILSITVALAIAQMWNAMISFLIPCVICASPGILFALCQPEE